MRRTWTYRAMTDSDLGLSVDEKKQAERRMHAHLAGRKQPTLIIFVALGCLIAVVAGLGPWVGNMRQHAGMPKLGAQLSGIGGVFLIGTVAYLALCWHLYVRPMRRALRDLGYEVCLN